MRKRSVSAAAAAMVAVPVGVVGWAGPAAAQPHAIAASCDPSDGVVKYKANMVLVRAGSEVLDASNIKGNVALVYSARCRWASSAVTLNDPLPQGKHAWASVLDWTYTEQAQCSVSVGGRGCSTAWSNDRGIQESAEAYYSGTTCGNCGDTWVGRTNFY
jgi:hypothetical protein